MIRQHFNHPITKRFIDAFPKFKADTGETTKYFWETWQNSPFYLSTLTETDLKDIYNHLSATYYNWHFIYLDDYGIAMNVMHVIEDYFPNCKERLRIQAEVRNMTDEEFKKSGIQINSSGSNPKIATEMDELIDLIDSQNASFQLKSPEQVLRTKFHSLVDGIWDDFIQKFAYQFVKLYNGVNNYLYSNPIDEEEQEDDE